MKIKQHTTRQEPFRMARAISEALVSSPVHGTQVTRRASEKLTFRSEDAAT